MKKEPVDELTDVHEHGCFSNAVSEPIHAPQSPIMASWPNFGYHRGGGGQRRLLNNTFLTKNMDQSISGISPKFMKMSSVVIGVTF